MAASEAQKRAVKKYQQEKVHRYPLEVPKDMYPLIKNAAELAGESVNIYIRKAVLMRMEKEGG